MRILGKKKSSKWIYLLALVGAVSIIFLLSNKKSISKNLQIERTYTTNLEQTNGDDFVGEGASFGKANCQSNEISRSGSFSCKCHKENKYGILKNLTDLSPEEVVVYSAWVHVEQGSAALVFHSEKNDLYKASTVPITTEGKWKLLKDTMVIPAYYQQDETKVYAYMTSNDGEVFIDDFKIEIFKKGNAEKSNQYGGATVELQIVSDNLTKLKRKREEAMERGLLFASRADMVEADMRVGDKEYAINMRLKGDLLDHLRGDNWSYRIQNKGDKEWNGMSTFSIHNSNARSHLAEWTMHEAFRREGIITPLYDFIRVKQNGKDLGLYAYEQHFDNSLLSANRRTIGPIMRHTDDGYWENVQKNPSPFYWTKVSDIELFNKENENDPDFARMRDVAHAMLTDFLDGNKSVDEVFDTELLAKYYALLELSHALHAQQFTNIRFYMNPLSGKLEPIGFDCFGDHLPNVNPDWTAVGESVNDKVEHISGYPFGGVYKNILFKDKLFFEVYMRQLFVCTSSDYIQGLKLSLQNDYEARNEYINTDKKYRDYKFDFDKLFAKASFTRNKILPLPNYSLKANYENDNKLSLRLRSFHYFPMEIIGFGDVELVERLPEPLFMEAYNNQTQLATYSVAMKGEYKKVYYKVLGVDSLFAADISKIRTPKKNIAVLDNRLVDIANHPLLDKNGRVLTLKSRDVELDQMLIIPKEYSLVIPAGTIIKFTGQGGIISNSPIIARGSKAQPIHFLGAGENGILLSDIDQESVFEHCTFSNLGEYGFRNIKSEGGLTAYKSKVEINHCNFMNIKAKNALYAVDAQYTLKNCNFENCQGDGIHAFMSFGKTDGVSFEKIGREAVELEGGKWEGSNIQMKSVMSYGILAKENVNIYLHTVKMQKGLYGIQMNSSAKAKVINGTFSNLQRAVQIESPSNPLTSLALVNAQFENVKSEYIMDNQSSLTINGSSKKPQ